jgi:hypothetical protein
VIATVQVESASSLKSLSNVYVKQRYRADAALICCRWASKKPLQAFIVALMYSSQQSLCQSATMA